MTKDISGVLAIHKPTGITSRQALDAVLRILPQVKMGHAGTLDPLASGVLVVCFGRATRLISFVQRMRKEYLATIRLGQRSPTHDLEVEVEDAAFAGSIELEMLERSLSQFRGDIRQVPPQHSAVKVQGRRAYELARKGQTASLESRPVHVERLACTRFEFPDADLEITCSSGTYVRSLVRDIGEDLGCGAVMTSLVRAAIGPFQLKDAVEIERLDRTILAQRALPIAAAVKELPSITVPDCTRDCIAHGRPIQLPPAVMLPVAGSECLLCSESGELLAVAEFYRSSQMLHPKIVLISD